MGIRCFHCASTLQKTEEEFGCCMLHYRILSNSFSNASSSKLSSAATWTPCLADFDVADFSVFVIASMKIAVHLDACILIVHHILNLILQLLRVLSLLSQVIL